MDDCLVGIRFHIPLLIPVLLVEYLCRLNRLRECIVGV
jgi:hypothetical protein